MKRKLLSIVLSLVMLLQLLPMATLAVDLEEGNGEETSASGETFYYAALGDSVGSGFGIEDSVEPSKVMHMTLESNYNNSPCDCYPAVFASALKDALGEDVTFDWANLGCASYMTSDFAKVLGTGTEAENHTSRLWRSMSDSNVSYLLDIYDRLDTEEARVDRYKSEMERNKELFSRYLENYDTKVNINGYVVEDTEHNSIATGREWLAFYGTGSKTEIGNKEVETGTWISFDKDSRILTYYTYRQSKDDPTIWTQRTSTKYIYNFFTGENFFDEGSEIPTPWEDFEGGLTAWLLAKEGGFADWFADEVDLIDADQVETELDLMDAYVIKRAGERNYLFHTRLTGELEKADLITVHVGANDLLEQLMYDLLDTGLGTDYYIKSLETESGKVTMYTNVVNPLMTTFHTVLFNLLSGDDMETALEQLEVLLEYYSSDEAGNDKITIDHVIDLLAYLNDSNISNQLVVFSKNAMDEYDTIIEEIQALNSDAQLALIGPFNPFGNSIEYNGERHTYANLIIGVLEVLLTETVEEAEDGGEDIDPASLETFLQQNEQTVLTEEGIKQALQDYDSFMNSLSNLDLSNIDISALLEVVQYNLMYTMLGTPAVDALDYMESATKDKAEELGVPFISLMNEVDNENDLNPHPLHATHAQMAEAVKDVLIAKYSYESNNEAYGTIDVPTQAVYGRKVTCTVKPEEGYTCDFVVAGGQRASLDGNTATFFSQGDGDTTVYAQFSEVGQPYAPVDPANCVAYTALGDAVTRGSLTGIMGTNFTSLAAGELGYPECSTFNLGTAGMTSADLLQILADEENPNHPTLMGCLKSSKVVTVNVGNCDLMMAILSDVLERTGLIEDTEDLAALKGENGVSLLSALLSGDQETVRNIVNTALGLTLTDIQLSEMFTALTDGNLDRVVSKAAREYARNMQNIERILNRELGDTTTLIGIGLYNPYNHCNLDFSVKFNDFLTVGVRCKFGQTLGKAMEKMNESTKSIFAAYGDSFVGISDMSGSSVLLPCLTATENQTVANRIVKAVKVAGNTRYVTTGAGEGGTIAVTVNGESFEPGTIDVTKGDVVVVTATANDGYTLRGFKLNGEWQTVEGNTFELTVEEDGQVIRAEFDNDYADYNYLTVVGDSIAAGLSQEGYAGFLSNPENAYVRQTAALLDTPNTANLGIAGLTTDELLAILGDENDPYHAQVVAAIQEADLLVVHVGINDLNMALLNAVYDAVMGEGASEKLTPEQQLALILPFMENANLDTLLNGLEQFLGIQISAEQYERILACLSDENVDAIFAEAEEGFEANWPYVVAAVQKINPDAELVCVGFYNAMQNAVANVDGCAFHCGDIYETYVNQMNLCISDSAEDMDYRYVNIKDKDEETGNVVELFCTQNKFSFDPHPTANGHKEIARRIVKALEDTRTVHVTGVTLTKESLSLTVNNAAPLTATIAPENATNKNLTWISSDPTVATVNDGKVTAIKPGTATITVTTEDGGFTATCDVTVTRGGGGSSGGGGGSGISYYTITVTAGSGGKIEPGTKSIQQGTDAVYTITPDEGYVIQDVLVDNVSVGAVKTYTFQKVSAKHTISAVFQKSGSSSNSTSDPNECPKDETCPIYPFADMTPTDWYHDGVHYCLQHKYVNGDGSAYFKPNADISRAMIVQILYNMENGNATNGAASTNFSDVLDDDWFATAVRWAASNEIVKGYEDNSFRPNASITREQLAAILYRYASFKGYDVSALADPDIYGDASSISSYAVNAVKWALGVGVINGKTATTIVPTGHATRAEASTMIYRFCDIVVE